MLQEYIQYQKKFKDILIMAHTVIGYPTLSDCNNLIVAMNQAGVDIIELQIPTKNAHLDGPIIRNANNKAVLNGVDVKYCFHFIAQLNRNLLTPIVLVAYYETVKNYGFSHFFNSSSNCNIASILIPDIPEQEQYSLHNLAFNTGITLVPIVFPKTPSVLYYPLNKFSEFYYCATHNGNTGDSTNFDKTLFNYIERIKTKISKPVAVGFGIKNKSHITSLKGYADIAVIGTRILEIIESDGIDMAGEYLKYLCH